MAIRFYSDEPKALLQGIYNAINEGHVKTWSYDADGDFIHTPAQWAGTMWLRPALELSNLLLTTVPPFGRPVTTVAYAVYHGRFAEMVLTHFDKLFSGVAMSALGSEGDILK